MSLEKAWACSAGWRFGRGRSHGCRRHGGRCGMRRRGDRHDGGDGSNGGSQLSLSTPDLSPYGACMAAVAQSSSVRVVFTASGRPYSRVSTALSERGRSVVALRRRWLQSRGRSRNGVGGGVVWREGGVGEEAGDVMVRRYETGWCVAVRVRCVRGGTTTKNGWGRALGFSPHPRERACLCLHVGFACDSTRPLNRAGPRNMWLHLQVCIA